mmetsp:Transcript_45085/g.81344  ORF Transcript_45085/g.81344 Transcript_45085/m.81344 type:complete len:168 (+) Transcript_45085:35-538(+)
MCWLRLLWHIGSLVLSLHAAVQWADRPLNRNPTEETEGHSDRRVIRHPTYETEGKTGDEVLEDWSTLLDPNNGDMSRTLDKGDELINKAVEGSESWSNKVSPAMKLVHQVWQEEMFRAKKVLNDDHMRLHKGLADHYASNINVLNAIPPNTPGDSASEQQVVAQSES